ncbi:MAG TPA: DUF2793 domain-containing protein [Gemmatimonadales bacterium]
MAAEKPISDQGDDGVPFTLVGESNFWEALDDYNDATYMSGSSGIHRLYAGLSGSIGDTPNATTLYINIRMKLLSGSISSGSITPTVWNDNDKFAQHTIDLTTLTGVWTDFSVHPDANWNSSSHSALTNPLVRITSSFTGTGVIGVSYISFGDLEVGSVTHEAAATAQGQGKAAGAAAGGKFGAATAQGQGKAAGALKLYKYIAGQMKGISRASALARQRYDLPNLGLRGDWPDGTRWGNADPGGGMNASLRRLDALAMAAVEDKDLAAPPGSPADGVRYLVPASATGAWAGRETQVAVWFAGGSVWEFYVPQEGWMAWAKDENVLYVFNGLSWVAL